MHYSLCLSLVYISLLQVGFVISNWPILSNGKVSGGDKGEGRIILPPTYPDDRHNGLPFQGAPGLGCSQSSIDSLLDCMHLNWLASLNEGPEVGQILSTNHKIFPVWHHLFSPKHAHIQLLLNGLRMYLPLVYTFD